MRNLFIFSCCFLWGLSTIDSQAQEHVYLWKDNKIIDFFPVENIDSITFNYDGTVPDIVTELTLKSKSVGKNNFSYQVLTPNPLDHYTHGAVLSCFYDYLVEVFYEKQPGTETDEERKELYNMIGEDYGETAVGNGTYTQTDFTYNQDGSIRYEVLAGLGYELFAFDKINNDINHLVLNPILCEAPETSPYAIETYDIQINDDELSLLIDADEEINYIYSGYGYKEVLDIYIEEKGIEYMVFLFGQRINREQFNTPQSWPVFDDSVYSLYLIGIDKDGNQIIKHSDFQRNNTQSSSEKRFNQSSRQNICLKSLSNQTSATNAERVRTRKENLHPSK